MSPWWAAEMGEPISTITLCTVMAGCRAKSASVHILLVHPREHCRLVKMEGAPLPYRQGC